MTKEKIRQIGKNIEFANYSNNIEYKNIAFFSLAECGAMGCPNEIIVATKEHTVVKWYCFNLAIDKHEDICVFFPPLTTFDCGPFGEATGIPKGWNYVDLGCGNHLLVHDDYYSQFQKEIKKLRPNNLGEVYASWRGIAQTLLNN